MDFINPRKCRKYVEKGWDEEKQMYYHFISTKKKKS
jgi:hypothetical protein